MQIGESVEFYYTELNFFVSGWIYFFDKKKCHVVVDHTIKLGDLLIKKDTSFPFSIELINNLKVL